MRLVNEDVAVGIVAKKWKKTCCATLPSPVLLPAAACCPAPAAPPLLPRPCCLRPMCLAACRCIACPPADPAYDALLPCCLSLPVLPHLALPCLLPAQVQLVDEDVTVESVAKNWKKTWLVGEKGVG